MSHRLLPRWRWLAGLGLASLVSWPARAEPATAELAPSPSVEKPEPAASPPPPRYRRVRTHPFGVAGGGALGQGYTLAALIATGALLYCAASADGDPGCGMHPSAGAFRELFIPLAGPWLALRRNDVHGDTKYALLFGGLGVVQAAGLLLVAYDLAVPRYRIEREARVSVEAVADAHSQRLVLKGRF